MDHKIEHKLHYHSNVGLREVAIGIHPFEKLCYECPLDDCHQHSNDCIQGKALGHRQCTRIGWNTMTEAMLRAGYLVLLHSIEIDDELLKKYPNQYTEEEVISMFKHPEYFGLRKK